MLKRRLIAALAALLVAAVGGVLLVTYVSSADDRAMAGMQTADVLVATTVIPVGTAGDSLAKLVVLKSLPVKALAEGTLTSLDTIAGLVSTVDLQPGEQLLGSRFADPATLDDPAEVKIPAGMQQLSISMERPRMLGNALTPGATVGVFVSLAKEGTQPAQTHLVLHKVLVTQVGEGQPTVPAEDGKAVPAADSVVVTFALVAADAEKVVFGAEHGRLWLTLEPTDATTSGTGVVTAGNVYR